LSKSPPSFAKNAKEGWGTRIETPGYFSEIRLWGDGPALRKSPHVRFSSATHISHRVVVGEVCLLGDESKSPLLAHRTLEKWGTHGFSYLGIGLHPKGMNYETRSN
jgi:hypothetical protein